MYYFKKVIIPNYSQSQFEAALRKVSLKRTSSLDSVASSTDVGTDKLFLGYESKSGLTFTRIKYFIEKYLPKFILKLDLTEADASYQLRFSLLSSLIVIGVGVLTLITFLALLSHPQNFLNALPLLILSTLYGGLIYLELKLTTAKINKALKIYNESQINS